MSFARIARTSGESSALTAVADTVQAVRRQAGVASNATTLHNRMQLLFALSVFFLFTLSRSSKVESESESESDILSSVDIIAFGYSQQVSQHWDCSRISDRAKKAEEARIWRMVISDARIKEMVAVSGNRPFKSTEQYKWIEESILGSDPSTAKSDLFVQNSVLLGMRKPNFDGGAAPVKLLYSKSKQVNQDALSVVLPQLEQSKNKIMDWMARNQASLPASSTTLAKIANRRFQVPQAVNYHPRVFKDAHFTTEDLVAWMALAAASRQKGHADAFRFFKITVQSFLPGFGISLEAVPKKHAREPTRATYLHRSFQHVPVGADLAFYFDGDRGNFLSLQGDSIVLSRPEGIVDGQQYAALVLFSNANVDASDLRMHQTKTDISMRKVFCAELEKTFAVRVSPGITDAEVQAVGVSTICSLAARLEQDSFLEAQRKLLESRPKLLIEILPERLVKLVIDYFAGDTYPITVSTHSRLFKGIPRIAVDSARLYVMSESEGLQGLSHSLANAKEGERRCIQLGDPRWFSYWWSGSSRDGQYIAFSHLYKASTDLGKQNACSTKWFMQNNKLEDERPGPVTLDGEALVCGLLSQDGQTLCTYKYRKNPITRIYRVRKEAEKDPVGLMAFELNGVACAVSGKGNRIIVIKRGQLEIHDISKDTSKLVCQIGVTGSIYICALNEDGSEAAFVKYADSELRIVEVSRVLGVKTDQPAIASIKFPESAKQFSKLIYDDGGKLHLLHVGGKVSLFDPLANQFILLETPQEEMVVGREISPNADYIVILQEGDKAKNGVNYRIIVKRKCVKADWRYLFGYEGKDEQSRKAKLQACKNEEIIVNSF